VIEVFCEKLIHELGATGLLVLGLYYILHMPLVRIAKSLKVINEELGEIAAILKRNKR